MQSASKFQVIIKPCFVPLTEPSLSHEGGNSGGDGTHSDLMSEIFFCESKLCKLMHLQTF